MYQFLGFSYPTNQRLIQAIETPKRVIDKSNIDLNYREGCMIRMYIYMFGHPHLRTKLLGKLN